jgi:signal transduction histidine kinase/ActR/RegA family two-component response regulator
VPPSLIGALLGRRSKHIISAFTLSILVLVALTGAADLWWWRQRTQESAESRARNLALVFTEYLRAGFAATDAALRQIAVHSQRVGGPDAGDAEWSAILGAAMGGLTGVGSISVADATGVIRHSTMPAIVGESRRGQYVFKRLSTLQSDELVVDTPFPARSSPTRMLIPLGRRLVRDGKFDGMVVVTLSPEAHRSFFRTMDVGAEGVVWVFHPDGVLLFREPSSDDPIGEPAKGNPVFEAARGVQEAGFLSAPLDRGGPMFLNAFNRIPTPPLIVGVSLSEQEVLQDWHEQRKVFAVGFTAVGVTLLAMLLLLFRQIDAKVHAEEQLTDVQRQEAERLKETNDRLVRALASEQQARRESEEASVVKDEFLMTVSHELRTPLNAIYGWARLMSAGKLREDQTGRALATIERNARAQTRLIDDLLDVSRVITGKLRLDVRRVNLPDVVQAAVDAIRPALDARRIALDTWVDPSATTIVADPERLQQIVWNLLSNAAKFTPEKGRVQIRVARIDSQIEIIVADSGIGITPSFLPHVFERFRQQDGGSRRPYGGLGLGLAIVRHLVELHGGSVQAESAGQGRGATFRVRLPLTATAQMTDVDERRGASTPTATAGRLDDLRVLVVDDEAEARELFASILESAGARVITAASAAEALTLLGGNPQDVLLSDIEMPGQDGYDLVRDALDLVRRRGDSLATIAVTAYARSEDKARALAAGYLWHLAKPVEPTELISVVGMVRAEIRK